MDQVHVIRHKVLGEGRSQRAVWRELGLSRVPVRKYLRHEAQPRARQVGEAVGSRSGALLEAAPQWTTPMLAFSRKRRNLNSGLAHVWPSGHV